MRLRLAALALGIVAGFVFGWARLTDPNTVAAGVVVGVKLQPWLAQLRERRRHVATVRTNTIPAADVL